MIKFSLTLLIIICAKHIKAQGSTCTYDINDRGVYRCTIRDQIILDEQSMLPVGGIHIPGFGNENVTSFTSSNTTMPIFPSLIIDAFVNLEEIILALTTETFQSPITNCQHLERLTMIVNDLTYFGGGIFRSCFNLTSMLVTFNDIEHIEDNAFDGLTSLQNLTLSNNRISSLSTSMFAPLTSLVRLDLDGNRIGELAPRIFMNNAQLETVDLSHNMIRRIDGDAFFGLQNLHTLRIGRLLDEIPIFTNLDSLQVLSLSNNNIMRVSADSFRNLPNLRDLDLSGNRIMLVNFTRGSERLLTKLERLDIRTNWIENLQDNAFTMLENMNDLDLSVNRIQRLNENSIRPIVQLRRLNVGWNRMQRIERGLFDGASNLEFQSVGNVCFDGDVNITFVDNYADFEDRVVPLLNECFNFANSVRVNLFVLMISFVKIMSALVS